MGCGEGGLRLAYACGCDRGLSARSSDDHHSVQEAVEPLGASDLCAAGFCSGRWDLVPEGGRDVVVRWMERAALVGSPDVLVRLDKGRLADTDPATQGCGCYLEEETVMWGER